MPGKARAATLPERETCRDHGRGNPDVDGVTFNGIFAPKATPRPVVERLSGVIRAALEKQTAIDQLAALGSQARGSTPEEFTHFLQDETRKWGELGAARPISSRLSSWRGRDAAPGAAERPNLSRGLDHLGRAIHDGMEFLPWRLAVALTRDDGIAGVNRSYSMWRTANSEPIKSQASL